MGYQLEYVNGRNLLVTKPKIEAETPCEIYDGTFAAGTCCREEKEGVGDAKGTDPCTRLDL